MPDTCINNIAARASETARTHGFYTPATIGTQTVWRNFNRADSLIATLGAVLVLVPPLIRALRADDASGSFQAALDLEHALNDFGVQVVTAHGKNADVYRLNHTQVFLGKLAQMWGELGESAIEAENGEAKKAYVEVVDLLVRAFDVLGSNPTFDTRAELDNIMARNETRPIKHGHKAAL